MYTCVATVKVAKSEIHSKEPRNVRAIVPLLSAYAVSAPFIVLCCSEISLAGDPIYYTNLALVVLVPIRHTYLLLLYTLTFCVYAFIVCMSFFYITGMLYTYLYRTD